MSTPSPADVSEPERSERKSLWPFLLLTFALAGLLVYPFPMNGRRWSPLFDLAHAPTFFAVFMLGTALIRARRSSHDATGSRPIRMLRRIKPWLIVFAVIWVIGVLCELGQALVSRQPSLADVVANTSGLAAGLFWKARRDCPSHSARIALVACVVAFLVTPAAAAIGELVECWNQVREFPLIASFERPRELTAWNQHAARMTRSTEWASHGNFSLCLTVVHADRHPGATMVWPASDWTGFEFFAFDVWNPQSIPLQLGVNIADRLHTETGFEPSDRFRLMSPIPPGQKLTIQIRVADLHSAPASRDMDLTQMAMIDLYLLNANQDERVLIDCLRLMR